MFHRTNRGLGFVGYVYVCWIYQKRDETLLGYGRVCFGDFKYLHWLPEIAYPAFNVTYVLPMLKCILIYL